MRSKGRARKLAMSRCMIPSFSLLNERLLLFIVPVFTFVNEKNAVTFQDSVCRNNNKKNPPQTVTFESLAQRRNSGRSRWSVLVPNGSDGSAGPAAALLVAGHFHPREVVSCRGLVDGSKGNIGMESRRFGHFGHFPHQPFWLADFYNGSVSPSSIKPLISEYARSRQDFREGNY